MISHIQVKNQRLNGELTFRRQRDNGAWEPPHLTHSPLLFPRHHTLLSLARIEGMTRLGGPYLLSH